MASAIEMSNVMVNTNLAACGGMIAAMIMVQIMYKKVDVTMALNGALAVPPVCGIWGTLAVPITDSEASFVTQLIGVVATGAFVVITSTIVWLAIKYTIGVRVSEEDEMLGCDSSEIGMEAYPDFQRVSIGGSSGISGYTSFSVQRG